MLKFDTHKGQMKDPIHFRIFIGIKHRKSKILMQISVRRQLNVTWHKLVLLEFVTLLFANFDTDEDFELGHVALYVYFGFSIVWMLFH